MAMGVGVVSLLVLVVVAVVLLFVRQMRLWHIMSHFPGPKAYPFIGCVYMYDRDPRAFFKSIQRFAIDVMFKTEGKKTMVVWMGPFPVIATGDVRDAETILSSNRQLDKGLFYQMLQPWLGDGLLLSKGKKWQSRRKLLTPSFHFSILSSFVDIFNEQAEILTSKFCGLVGSKSVNIMPLLTGCTLDVICATTMGINVGAQNGNNKDYVQAIVEMSDLLQERQKYPWLWLDVIYNLLPNGKRHKRNLKILHGMTKKVIQDRIKERSQQNGTKTLDSNSIANGKPTRKRKMAFLDLLLQLHEENENFTLDDVREEVDTFMFEGHDTTSASLTWILFMIGCHPHVQEKIHQELDDVFGDDRDRKVTSEDIQKLLYLGCVIKETLRLYPSVPLIGRQLEEDAILSGHRVPKGTLLIVAIFWLGRDPDYFPDADEFNPDNFLPENVEGRDPFAFVPFSAGPRNCIGQKFALMEEKVVLAYLLRKLKFRSLKAMDEVTPTGELILRPYDSLEMEVSLRP